ncbi:Serine/Threonine-Protein Kinase Nek11 [Manis pentadactyla]|nr:Serine/Threonine-Protein Kinase Nek11 [Manis pentadactyla]
MLSLQGPYPVLHLIRWGSPFCDSMTNRPAKLSQYHLTRKVLKEISVGELNLNETVQANLEAQLLSKLDHPAIVKFHTSFVEQDSFFIIMEYCEGQDLDYKIQEFKEAGKTFPESQIIEWFIQLLLGVDYMHERRHFNTVGYEKQLARQKKTHLQTLRALYEVQKMIPRESTWLRRPQAANDKARKQKRSNPLFISKAVVADRISLGERVGWLFRLFTVYKDANMPNGS